MRSRAVAADPCDETGRHHTYIHPDARVWIAEVPIERLGARTRSAGSVHPRHQSTHAPYKRSVRPPDFPPLPELIHPIVIWPDRCDVSLPMRKLSFVVLALVAVGCSSNAVDSEQASTEAEHIGATSAQLGAFQALSKDSAKSWKWIQNDDLQTPMHLSADRRGEPTLLKGASPEITTKAFLAKYKDLYSMRSPDAELSVDRTVVDALSMTHVRMQQSVRGIPVVGAQLFAHYDQKGILTAVDARYVPNISEMDVNPAFDAKVAVDVAMKDAVSAMNGIDEKALLPNAGRLVIFAPNAATARLAYEVKVDAQNSGNEPAIWITTIDAKTGEVLNRYNNIQTLEGSGTGVLGDTKKLNVSQSGTGFSMIDTSRGVTIQTFTSQRQQITADEGAAGITSSSSTNWDGAATAGAGAAVDAHFFAGVVFDYYKKHHARNGLDGVGGDMLSAVHFGVSYDNAFWNSASMNYGDGGQLFKPLSAGVDVVGHEFTHGVTEKESALIYQGQAGALNESISDIFSVYIEHEVKPDDVNNWLMGESITKSTPLRDFKNPKNGQQPDHMSKLVQTQQDNGGVHTNSGIPNNAAFLMTMGGSNPTSGKGPKFGIGYEKSEKLWYRANTTYIQSSATFAAAATATMQAAKDIALTDNETNIVDCAWKATGVVPGDCATNIVDPKATTVPASTDTTTGDTTADTSGTDDSSDETPTPAPAKKKKAASIPTTATGCNVQGGSADFGPLAGLFAAILGMAASRRRRR